MSINVGIAGSVSVGKTTVLNSLIGQYIGQTSRKRSTYVPFKFNHNLKCKEHPIDWIKNNIESLNEEKNKMEVINYDVCFDWIKESKEFSIIDFPGLNDPHEEVGKMETLMFSQLENIQYLIYVIDSTNCLNSKCERDFLTELLTKMSQNTSNYSFNEIIILFNKYDDDDDELNDLIVESEQFIKTTLEKLNVKVEIHMFRINARKLMVKNILRKYGKDGIQTIPETILKKILSEYHGKKKAKKIMKEKKIKESQINDIEVSKSENDFITLLELLANTNIFHTQYILFVEKHMKTIKEDNKNLVSYLDKICNFFDIISKNISNSETTAYYQSIGEEITTKIFIDELNVESGKEISQFTMMLLGYENILKKYKINIEKIILLFCKNVKKNNYYSFVYLEYILELFEKYNIKNFIEYIQHFFEYNDDHVQNIFDLEKYTTFIIENNTMTYEFSLKFNMFMFSQLLYRNCDFSNDIVSNGADVVMYPILLADHFEQFEYLLIEYINQLISVGKKSEAIKIKMDYNSYKGSALIGNVNMRKINLEMPLLLDDSKNLNIIKENVKYYPNEILTAFLVEKYFDNIQKNIYQPGNIENIENIQESKEGYQNADTSLSSDDDEDIEYGEGCYSTTGGTTGKTGVNSKENNFIIDSSDEVSDSDSD